MRRPLLLALLLQVSVSAFATDPDDLQHAVREALIHKPYLGAGWIRVRSERGKVTLTGRVPDELRRANVVLTVRNMEGVLVVKDDLEIDPSLDPPRVNPGEPARARLANARKILAADELLAVFTTLHVARTGHGLLVTGEVAAAADRARILHLLRFGPEVKLEVRVVVRPDATRRAPVEAPSGPTRLWADSVTRTVDREPLLHGRVSIVASVEGDRLILRGTAKGAATHDLAFEIVRAQLIERQRALLAIAARSGELTKLLGGDPGHIEGTVPARLDSLVVVVDGE
jgi:hypothetical protein